ncbi:MAG TPA: FAD:protein FMN transferase [Solirubrobacteraceae bacterium]|jgi:thiamine biosynthesis lipoprotein
MSGLATARWQALGTSVVLQVTDRDALSLARAIVERELDAIDRACSRFRADSELSRVNAAAGRRVQVDPLLVAALQVALRAAELTDGDVDPTVGEALELAGYNRDWTLLEPAHGAAAGEVSGPERSSRPASHVPPAHPVLPAHPESPAHPVLPAHPESPSHPVVRVRVRAGWRTVQLDPLRGTVRVPAPIKLDLGATAKAWAADRAARAVAEATGAGALVSLGGDLSTAGRAPADGWRIRVTDDHRNDLSAPGQTISIRDGALATSSTTARRWQHDGRTMHHIIDPDTSAPVVGPWCTASVAAASCVDANIASTAALVRALGAPQWLEDVGLPARLVDQAGRVCNVGDWPA